MDNRDAVNTPGSEGCVWTDEQELLELPLHETICEASEREAVMAERGEGLPPAYSASTCLPPSRRSGGGSCLAASVPEQAL